VPGALLLSLLIALLASVVAGCGGSSEPGSGAASPAAAAPQEEETAGHIHGLGIDPADGALFVATHSGLFRAAKGEARARRVGDSRQDTMGFTVVGKSEFLGSGHPGSPDQPPLLGLIRSEDAGRSWEPVSLSGEADFHALRAAGKRVYGADATRGRFIVSDDGGATWDERPPPAFVFDVAIDPDDPDHIVAATEEGLATSRDAGRSWRPPDPRRVGLLAWNAAGLALVDQEGGVHRSADGRKWKRAGEIGGRPAALAASGSDLLAGTHGNEVKISRDGGRSWELLATL
jgi:photosystem II stability/assembly factor-like uncharacterized protein